MTNNALPPGYYTAEVEAEIVDGTYVSPAEAELDKLFAWMCGPIEEAKTTPLFEMWLALKIELKKLREAHPELRMTYQVLDGGPKHERKGTEREAWAIR